MGALTDSLGPSLCSNTRMMNHLIEILENVFEAQSQAQEAPMHFFARRSSVLHPSSAIFFFHHDSRIASSIHISLQQMQLHLETGAALLSGHFLTQ